MENYPVDDAFNYRLRNCLDKVKVVLERNKNLCDAGSVGHRYADKFAVVNYLVNASSVSFLNTLSKLGLSDEQFGELIQWAQDAEVTLRFSTVEECSFDKEVEKEVEATTKGETEVKGGAFSAIITSKVFHVVREYHFTYRVRFELVAFKGVDTDGIVLCRRNASQNIIQSSRSSPYTESKMSEYKLSLSWLLRAVSVDSKELSFSIDRSHPQCHTPAQNEDVYEAIRFFKKLSSWSAKVRRLLCLEIFSVQLRHSTRGVNPSIESINCSGIFNPVFPLLSTPDDDHGNDNDNASSSQSTSSSSRQSDVRSFAIQAPAPISASEIIHASTAAFVSDSAVPLSTRIVQTLLCEESRSADAYIAEVLERVFRSPALNDDIITAVEATLVTLLHHMSDIADSVVAGVGYIESLLRKQLVAAIGKELQPSHFSEYMQYRYNKLYRSEFQPRAFSHAVRRSHAHSSEGTVSIEIRNTEQAMFEPIRTFSRLIPEEQTVPLQFAINASTNIRCHGQRFVHTWLSHSFSDNTSPPQLKLVSRAKQFSSFIVLLGRVVADNVFEPKHAMFLQNKDEISIPLDLEVIPTLKEFKAAVESLSPEQHRFAKAFRSMQLESTLFGVLVLQVKPQLEMVMKLEANSLTKEIDLTQRLMKLCVEYEIPTDLLSFDDNEGGSSTSTSTSASASSTTVVSLHGGRETSSRHRLEQVRHHADQLLAMIDSMKEVQVQEREQEAVAELISLEDPYVYEERCVELENNDLMEACEPVNFRNKTKSRRSKPKSIIQSVFHGFFGGSSQSKARAWTQDMHQEEGGGFLRGEMSERLCDQECDAGFVDDCDSAGGSLAEERLCDEVRERSMPAMARKSEAAAPSKKAAATTAPASTSTSTSTSTAAPSADLAASSAAAGSKLSDNKQSSDQGASISSSTSTSTSGSSSASTSASTSAGVSASGSSSAVVIVPQEISSLPQRLERNYALKDSDDRVRPTIINPGSAWFKSQCKSLLDTATTEVLGSEQQEAERNKAFSLLDALTRSGALAVECAQLHVVVAGTICFDDSIMDTIVKGNVNPIESVERCSLITTATMHGLPVLDMVASANVSSLQAHSSDLFLQ